MPEVLPTHNLPEYRVSEIAGAIKHMVEDRFGFVRVRGEVSGWKLASSGHAYFRLKDEDAVLDAVIWRGTIGKLAFKPEDGLEVIASGRLTTYPGKSSYQIVVDRLEPAGAGALMAMLEERKQRLAKEGLFDEKRKKPLTFLPQTIGVITSPTGAVIRDILHRISERCGVHVLVWPVAVQGEGAAEQIAEAIEGFNLMLPGAPADAPMERRFAGSRLALSTESATNPQSRIPNPDLLIIARGGGSVEDLWAFNEEIVVRAVAASRIPIISAVGHETDTTLIDYAADKRAPTPTAAAEMAVPVALELRALVQKLGVRLHEAVARGLALRAEILAARVRLLPKLSTQLEQRTQRLDEFAERLKIAPLLLLARKSEKLSLTANRLSAPILFERIKRFDERILELYKRMHEQPERYFTRKTEQVNAHVRMLAAMNVSHTLKRGFVLARSPNGSVITSAKAAKGSVNLVWQDGEKTATIS